MNLLTIILTLAVCAGTPSAQTQPVSPFKAAYERQVKAVGPAGPGVETILDKWEADSPDDPDMLRARFNWNYTKSQSSKVVTKAQDRFMGAKPLLSLPDTSSKGGKINYFEEIVFDPELYTQATKYISRAIRLRPDELRYRFDKISALISYEKESPDLATEEIRTLIDYDASAHPQWLCDGQKADKVLFDAAIQEYCFTFFRIGSEKSFESFRSLSEKMHAYSPKDPVFLDNIGTWWLIAKKNPKQALSVYKKVLKLDPDDYTALKNIILLARNEKDVKLEKKYLPKLMKVTTDESEKASCASRLEYLSGKK